MRQRDLILIGLVIVSGYDIITTIYGTAQILGGGIGSIVAGLLLGGIIGGLLYYSYEIHNGDFKEFEQAIYPLWFAAVAYDLWTSFMGNREFIIQAEWNAEDAARIILLLGLTVFVSACPIMLSYARNNPKFMGWQG